MRYGKQISLLVLLSFLAGIFSLLPAQNADKVQENVISALKASDGQAIGTWLNDLCDLDVPGYRGTCSKAQAGRFVKDFFGSHSLSGFKIIRQGTLADKEQYTMGEIRSGQKTWKVYFVVKEKDGKGVVPLFHITE